MPLRRALLATVLIGCGFAAGLVLTGRMPTASETIAQPPQVPAPSGVRTDAPPAGALPDFTAIADKTVRAVTNISSVQVVQRQNSPYANDPFFQYFFGDPDDLFGSRRSVERSLGSGVIVSADGYVLTNNHVVMGEGARVSRQAPEITVTLADKREVRADIIGVDPPTDLALLKLNARNLPTVAWGDSSRLKVAEWVLAIGNPFQLNQSVTLGIVSAVNRANMGISAYEDFIQTDAAINPGNSGGALINARGELVGINTAIFSQSGGYQGIGFAVPSNIAHRVMDDFIKYGEVRRGSIGPVELSPLSSQVADQLDAPDTYGALVTGMYRDTAVYRAGVRPGDIIVSFDGTAITDLAHLSRLVQDARIGSAAVLGVIREGRRVEIKVPIQPMTRPGGRR